MAPPLATIINWQFDGASYNLGLKEVTGIPGAAFKICYGMGFEGDGGNTYALSNQQSAVDDVHFGGVIATLFDNDLTSAVLNYAHAWDITDGFTGLTVMPFIVSESGGQYSFTPNTGGYITRLEPTTEIGDWDALSLLLRTNLIESLDMDIALFLSGSWSHTSPSQTSQNPYYQVIGMGISPFYRDNFFVTLGARYYDYEYTGSSSPIGEPVSIDELTSLDALNPVVDEVWDAYLSLTFRY